MGCNNEGLQAEAYVGSEDKSRRRIDSNVFYGMVLFDGTCPKMWLVVDSIVMHSVPIDPLKRLGLIDSDS